MNEKEYQKEFQTSINSPFSCPWSPKSQVPMQASVLWYDGVFLFPKCHFFASYSLFQPDIHRNTSLLFVSSLAPWFPINAKNIFPFAYMMMWLQQCFQQRKDHGEERMNRREGVFVASWVGFVSSFGKDMKGFRPQQWLKTRHGDLRGLLVFLGH